MTLRRLVFAVWPGRPRTRIRRDGYWRWPRSTMGWIGRPRPGLAAWIARRCGIGSVASTKVVPTASLISNQRAVARNCRPSSGTYCGNWWRPARIRRRMEWCAGAAWTCNVSLDNASVSIYRQLRSGGCSRGSAFRISAPARSTLHRMRRRSRLLKKLPRSGRRGCEYACAGNADRGLVYQWAKKGTRPRQPKDQRYENAYLFGAVCPGRNTGIAVIMPHADTEAMQKHVDEISLAVAPGAHALIILDKAAWHTTRKLKLPDNLTLVPLPPACPELNAAENIWQYLRQTYLSNRVFENYTAILDACQTAWRSLLNELGRIASIATRRDVDGAVLAPRAFLEARDQ